MWLGLGLGLAPFAWALGFCFPRGDDFDEVTRAMFLFDLPGGLYEVGREWLTWSGRYTYHFLAVFLGKAGELRLASGLVCGAALALHGAAFYGLARAAGVARRDAAPLAALALLALCASIGWLPGFYLLTEALTTGLQSAAALAFFWSLCALWERCAATPPDEARIRRARRMASLMGVLAAGVYEHAALAVLAGSAVACLLAWFGERRAGPGTSPGRLRSFLVVGAWCLGGVIFSFLAPGNFARRAARGLDAATVRGQLAALPADWLHALESFAAGSWPFMALGLALLVALLQKLDRPGLARREALLLGILVPAAFCLFSLGVTALHALSDAPLPASPKLGASLGLYAAFALGFGVHALLRALPGLPCRGRGPALVIGAGLLALGCASDNFQRTLENAVNGDMALYAMAMQRRDAWLRHVGEGSPWRGKFRFGLAGEALHPGIRSRAPNPGAAVTPVARWARPVFPVWTGGGLKDKGPAWPNTWAAWMYGVEAVAAVAPAPAGVVAALRGSKGAPGGPVELRLPAGARALGLAGAWRVNALGGPNPTFALDWLVLESEKPLPKTLAVLAPSPITPARMAPIFLQAWLLRQVEGETRADALARWAGPELAFTTAAWHLAGAPSGVFRYAFPLGRAAPLAQGEIQPGEWPAVIFLQTAGTPLLRLAPAGPDLDTGRESG
ncbi:hypothetical protein [Desulfovibrio sp.]|uniref:hypothetical protein n=1 Tax=Desulfovibrio sp. TaxID=885 RepID=UPI0023CCF8FF|nr:hypothetical protein [Desulfovibrio sp.]MDE7241379.1 hypothetical protein [Desulfovibrio sp.]